ncbi:MAG: peptide chain release factor aRF-1 [Candidatus Hydrothermarchaeota archaeon]
MDSKEKYAFKRKIEELEKKSGKGTELISLYIPPGRAISDVTTQLKQEHSQAANIKSKRTRKNVQSALETISQRLKMLDKIPENGLVIFCGTVTKGISEDMEIHLIVPIEPLQIQTYRCDSKFFLDPLKDMIEEKDTYGLIVLDRREATIGILKGKRIEIMSKQTSGVPGKFRAGGQSAPRFERLREWAAHEFFVRIGERASEILLQIPDLKGVLIGGPGPTKEEFFKGDYLHYEIKQKVIDILDVGYTGEYGIHELVDKAEEIFSDLEIVREKKLVQRFFRELVKEEGLAVYGLEDVKKYLEMGAVDTLILSEGLRMKKVLYECPSCGGRLEKIISNTKEELKCECNSIPEIKDEIDVVEELTRISEEVGTKVYFVSTDTEEGSQIANAFKGIAAILRYKPT